ncbi:MAG: hypothetical protein V8S57_06235, partial [Oscillospiraceae bacterium]
NIPSPRGGEYFFRSLPGVEVYPRQGNPRWSTKKISSPFWRGDFFLVAPGEWGYPDRGNPRWSTKNLSSQKDGLSTAPVIKLNKQSKKSNTGK